jgi:hypothetical protein
LDNVHVSNHKIYCLTETWLNDTIFSQNLFPDTYSVFRADRDYSNSNTTRGGGVLIAVTNLLKGIKRRHDLETTTESVWFEIPGSDNVNLLIGNHYFPSDCSVTIIDNYLNSLERNLNAYQYRVIILSDFNTQNYDWINGAPFPNSYYNNKIKGNLIHTATCLLGLEQYNNCVANSALLDLVFSNINDLNATITSFPVVTTDKYHPPLILSFKLTHYFHYSSLTPRHSYAKGDYILLYNILHQTDWSYVLNENSVDAAVNNLTAMVRKAINIAIPLVRPKNSAFPPWFSKLLKFYIVTR